MKIAVTRLPHAADLPLPSYATEGAAGLDLVAAVGADMLLAPGQFEAVPAGIALALPEGYEAQVRPRSGLALRNGISVLNAPGTIDSDYRGEVKVILVNHGSEPFRVARGLKIAQLVVAKFARIEWDEKTELESTARASGGFGSTGVRI